MYNRYVYMPTRDYPGLQPDEGTTNAQLDRSNKVSGSIRSLLVILLAGLLVLGLAGCSSGASGPEDTVRAAFKALEAKNAEKLASYYAEDVRDETLSNMEYAFSIVDKFKVSNLETTVTEQTADTASVEADYDRVITMDGEKIEEHVTEIYELSNVDGKWLLLREATEVETVVATPTPTATPGAFQSPEGTVLAYYSAIADRDIGAIQRCFREDLRDDIKPALEEYFSYMDTVSIPTLEVEIVSQTDSEATVDARYELYTTDSGETFGGPVHEDLHLEKVGGKWLIAEDMGLAG
jgi:hypothetical protein